MAKIFHDSFARARAKRARTRITTVGALAVCNSLKINKNLTFCHFPYIQT